MARLQELNVEKGSELPEGHKDRKHEGRVVLMGNQLKDQHGKAAIFEELSANPAAMGACKFAMAYGCLRRDGKYVTEDHIVQQSDGKQAYTEADLGGGQDVDCDPEGPATASMA